jgi:hypothetical protein
MGAVCFRSRLGHNEKGLSFSAYPNPSQASLICWLAVCKEGRLRSSLWFCLVPMVPK